MTAVIGFSILVVISCFNRDYRHWLRTKSFDDWMIDIVSLLFQGFLGQIICNLIIYMVMKQLGLPGYRSISLGFFSVLLIRLVVIDYLYYWNHRWFHRRKLFRYHRVHHTAPKMDIFVASRNSIITNLMFVTFWIHGFCLYFIKDHHAYFMILAATALMDLHRHSELWPKQENFLTRMIGAIFITPRDHAWHHAPKASNYNFGEILKIWDILHGTLGPKTGYPDRIGHKNKDGWLKSLLFPILR